jgi:hypothetical protein
MMELIRLMPPDLRRSYDAIDDNDKGGRVLMRKALGPHQCTREKIEAIEKEASAKLSSSGPEDEPA